MRVSSSLVYRRTEPPLTRSRTPVRGLKLPSPGPRLLLPLSVTNPSLRLPAPRRASIRRNRRPRSMSISQRMRALREPAARFTNSRHLLVLHFDEGACSPATALGHGLLVRGEVEEDEEDEVRGKDADAGDGGEFLACALPGVGEVRPVGAGEVGPGGEVDEA